MAKKRESFNPDIRVGRLEIDVHSRQINTGSKIVELTGREYRLFCHIAFAPGLVLKEELRWDIWGGAISMENIRATVYHIRRKLEGDPERPTLIRTSWGSGYFFDERG